MVTRTRQVSRIAGHRADYRRIRHGRYGHAGFNPTERYRVGRPISTAAVVGRGGQGKGSDARRRVLAVMLVGHAFEQVRQLGVVPLTGQCQN